MFDPTWTAPKLDEHIRTAAWDPHEAPAASEPLVRAVERLADRLEPLQPETSGATCQRWQIWLPVDRGPIEAYASHFDALHDAHVDGFEDLERQWLTDYPEALDRRPLVVSRHPMTIHVTFPEELHLWVDRETRDIGGLRTDREEAQAQQPGQIPATPREVEPQRVGGDPKQAPQAPGVLWKTLSSWGTLSGKLLGPFRPNDLLGPCALGRAYLYGIKFAQVFASDESEGKSSDELQEGR